MSPSNSKVANETTPCFISALPVAPPLTDLQLAISKRRLSPLHPFNLPVLSQILRDTNLIHKYPTLLHSLNNGFLVGVPPIRVTFTPDNTNSISTLYSEFLSLINKEFSLGRYLGPFSRTQLEHIIGPFQTSPLSLVPKPNSSNYRLIQNLSFPYQPVPIPSINSAIDSSHYPSTFGTFLTICLIIRDLPPGSQASTRDVADAYRTLPLHPSQWNGLVIKLNHDSFALNSQNSFGLASAGGVWGYMADALADIFRSQGFGPLSKWVDDFIFFRVPAHSLSFANSTRRALHTQVSETQNNARRLFVGPELPDSTIPHYDEDFTFPLQRHSSDHFSYSEQHLDQLSKQLGLPWKEEKSTAFSSSVVYLGFIWDLDSKTVTLHPDKQRKYQTCICEWLSCKHHTLQQTQSLYGKLLHTTYIVPHGRLYLTKLEKMIPTYFSNPNKPHRAIKSLLSDLQWWLMLLKSASISRPIPSFQPYYNLNAYSDASHQGIGIYIFDMWAAFAFSPSFKQRSRDIAWAEAAALEILILALDLFPFSETRLKIYCDNTVVSDGWRIGRSRNTHVNDIFKTIYQLLDQRQLQLQLQYIPSTQNPADKPSRGISLTQPQLPFFPLPIHLQHEFIRVPSPEQYPYNSRMCSLPSTNLPSFPRDFDFPQTDQLFYPD